MTTKNKKLVFLACWIFLAAAIPAFETKSDGVGEWQLLTKQNFSSQIRLHPHILLIVTLPWSGESRSLMRDVARLVTDNHEDFSSLRLRFMYRNAEKVLADAIGAATEAEETTVLYYHNSVSYKYGGRLRAQNVLASLRPYVAVGPEELPFKSLKTPEKLKEFVDSTDKALILFEFCEWTSKLLARRKNNGTDRNGFALQGNFLGFNISGEASRSPAHLGKNIQKGIESAKMCGVDYGLGGVPWLGDFSSVNDSASFVESEQMSSFCNREEYQLFDSFLSKFTTVAREFFLPPERYKFGLVSERSMLSTFGIEDSSTWLAVLYLSGCPGCSKIIKKEEDLKNALQMDNLIVTELEGLGNTLKPALPANQPSALLFVDRSSDLSETRIKCKKALDSFRELALHYHISRQSGGQHGDKSEKPSVQDYQALRSTSGYPKLKLSQTIKLKDKTSTFMIVNEGKQVTLDNIALDLQGGSLKEILDIVLKHEIERGVSAQTATSFQSQISEITVTSMTAMATTMATTTTLLLLLILTAAITTASSAPILGLDTFLTHQSRLDRHATNDSFLSLSSTLKNSLSHSTPLSHTPHSLISSLLSLSLPLSLHVRLVGPSFPPSSAALLSSFLTAASQPSNHFHVIAPYESLSHRLAVQHSLHLDVSHSPSLASLLTKTLSSELAKTTSSLRSPLLSVSYDLIDQIIKQDFEKEKPVHGVYLYFLDMGKQSKPYAYNYGSGDSSPAFTKCLGSIWTGKDRYIWIDLGAGPVDYGPALSGDGVLPRGEFHPLAVLHGRPKAQKALLADLASLVWSAYQVLLVPSLRIPVQFENSLIVQFIHVYGSDGGKDLSGLDWKLIERTFMDEANGNGLLLGDQTLSFRTNRVSYSDCPICSFAISRSINSYTSRFLFDNYTLIASEYLDSKRLHQILSDSAEEFRRVAGLPEEDFARVLPVYVFDLDYTMLLLLDRYHQSVAFKDMVIAVRTKNTQTVSDYSCNGRHVFTQTRELERPLVGSILQSMWGVSPTHMLWSPRHNTTLVDYTWSIGQTPFGPFSEISSLSFVQKDAARRNVLLTSLNYTISSAVDVLQSIAAHGGERKLLKRSRHVEFIQRWNLFKYKLDKAVSAMSLLDFGMALFYLRSSDHDLYAIHSLVYQASQEVEASLVCFKDPPVPWNRIFMVGFVIVFAFYLHSKRGKIFRNKSKQF